eukprot:TRINITY_DN2318_c0_g1_i5.p1 TRINITY_DN2318_c0_g1~~TRINITY_DN2318_c0_g1_i5.p1  ORF type:complete len:268 (+),score=48.88 TRINITY_DN2318_c0_g1_i5:527-1330(+)
MINQRGVLRTEVAGEYLTKQLFDILATRGEVYPRYKSTKPDSQYNKVSKEFETYAVTNVVREIKHQTHKLLDFRIENLRFNESVDNTIFELPDKRKIELSKEIYSIPEMIFRPIPEMNYEGIPDLIKSSLERVEYEARRELLSNIYVVGGNSLLVNYIERLQKEMYEKELWGFSNKAKVFTATGNNEKQHCNWLGGSIMGSMATFPQFMMTKNDYEEHGAILIERRCLSQASYQTFQYFCTVSLHFSIECVDQTCFSEDRDAARISI